MAMYILDTNVVIYFLDSSLSSSALQFLKNVVDDRPIISVITKMETLGFNFKSVSEQTIMETFINGSELINIDDAVVNKTIAIRKNKKIRLPDAIIAATAMVYNLKLITHNTSDFKNISDLQLIDLKDL